MQRRYAQMPRCFAPPRLQCGFARAQFLQRTNAPFIISLPVLCEAQGARRAVEEANIKPLLDTRNRFRDCGTCEMQALARCSKTAGFDRRHERTGVIVPSRCVAQSLRPSGS